MDSGLLHKDLIFVVVVAVGVKDCSRLPELKLFFNFFIPDLLTGNLFLRRKIGFKTFLKKFLLGFCQRLPNFHFFLGEVDRHS